MARSLRRCAVQPVQSDRGRRMSATRWVTVACVAVALCPVSAFAQSGGETARTAWGAPDLQGVWDYRTTTPLERPEHLGTTAVVTGDDADGLIEWRLRDNQAIQDRVLGADWSDHLETGLAGGNRTSLIVDPPNGRMPITVSADEWRADRSRFRAAYGPEVRLRQERCMIYKSAPINVSGDNNNVQILQTPNTVAMLHEMIHETVIIPLDGRPHLPPQIRQWQGDARGHWDGDTLVVETLHRHPQWTWTWHFFPPTPNLRVIERFTRVDLDTLQYEFTVEDPESFTSPWSAAWPMQRTAVNGNRKLHTLGN